MTIIPEEIKTPREIVNSANELARQFYALQGYEVPEGYRFDQAFHPQERTMWAMAVHAYEFIECTDVEDALNDIIEDE